MGERVLKFIVSFETTTQALAMESICRKRKLPGRLIPLPSAVSAGCGLAWCALLQQRKELEKSMEEHHITYEGLYEVLM